MEEKKSVVFLRFYVLYLVRVTYYPYTAHVRPSVYIWLKYVHIATAQVVGTLRTTTTLVQVFK